MEKLIVIILCLQLFGNAQAEDQTLQPHARGESVVDATIGKIRSECILVDDKYLMRRIAAVETDFGRNSTPNKGGIWRVTDAIIKTVKDSCKNTMRMKCNDILRKFGFDLTKADISEMDVPLYSALVMDSYITIKSGVTLPASKSKQADFWIKNIQPKGNKASFLAKSNFKASCSRAKMELVFAIDASGSVGAINFQKTLSFLQNVVQDLSISPEETRVAIIRYSSSSHVIFKLDTFQNARNLIDGIGKIRYTGGGTATNFAIDLARTAVFQNAREKVPKVFILITDGHSNSRPATISAADRLKNDTTTIFTIGVGNVNPDEMRAVASQPYCTHFFSLSSYSEIDAIINEIQQVSCEVPLVVDTTSTNGNGTGNGTETPTEITDQKIPKDNQTKVDNVDIENNGNNNNNTKPGNTTNVKIVVVCGIVRIYASNDFNKPSEAVHTYSALATDGNPGWIRSPATKRLFLSIVSQRRFDLTEDECTDPHYNMTINPKDEGGVTVVCRENGIERNCTLDDIKLSFHPVCDDDEVPNPCTKANILNNKMRFEHPKSSNKYIQCKPTGKMEIVKCPKGTQYDKSQCVCDPQITGIPTSNPVYNGTNPCNKQAIMNGQFYFAHPLDRSAFIQCDEWGGAFLVNCPNNTVWSQQAYTCVHHSSAVSPTFNPCKSSKNLPSFHEYPKVKNAFIHCDKNGKVQIVQCPSGAVWSQAKLQCVRDSVQLALIDHATPKASIVNYVIPTTPKAPTKCIFGSFLPHRDPHKYYVCEVSGLLREMPCPRGLVWVQAQKVCNWPSGSS